MSGGGSSGSNFLGGHWNGNTDPIGNAIASYGGGQLDPMNLYATNQPGGANYVAKNGTSAPSTLPNLGANSLLPNYYTPSLGRQLPNFGSGPYNAMAAQLAGPMYSPQLTGQPQSQPQPQMRMQPSSQFLQNFRGSLGGNPLLRRLPP